MLTVTAQTGDIGVPAPNCRRDWLAFEFNSVECGGI
jgi:hypothetical protein